ncbi:MAG: PQQ-binding-like beta-propeller repeat protein, partial [Verrucomicrobiales bacterium]|nr:PQQ-binding-like beta-propeller repeat protein [Verrucomicrobiales bacterium]
PNHNGSTDEKDLPVKFSKTQGVLWSAPMPGPSAATPVVFGDHVFVSSSSPGEQQLLASAYDRKTGALKWKHVVAPGHDKDRRSNYAAPSPVTDGQLVSFYYGNGALATYTADGKKLWAKDIQKDHGEFAYQWTPASSPLLHNDTLYLQVLHRNAKVHGRGRDNGKSYILGLDPKTGEQLWKVYRPAKAKAESLEAYSTPVPFTHGGREEILIAGGDCITGHDAKSGRELWRWARGIRHASGIGGLCRRRWRALAWCWCVRPSARRCTRSKPARRATSAAAACCGTARAAATA